MIIPFGRVNTSNTETIEISIEEVEGGFIARSRLGSSIGRTAGEAVGNLILTKKELGVSIKFK